MSNFNRRPFENPLLLAIENGKVTSPVGDEARRLVLQRLRVLRNQRDAFVFSLTTEDDPMAMESFRGMAIECNTRMRNIRNVLYQAPAKQ